MIMAAISRWLPCRGIVRLRRLVCVARTGAASLGRLRSAISARAVGQRRRAAAAGFQAPAARRAEPPAEGCAQRPDHPARRRRLRPGVDLRRRDQHADAEQARRRGHQLQHLPHHVDLLAHARRVAHRAQPPARRQRHDRGARGRLGRLYRRDPQDLGDDGRGACGTTATRPAAIGKWHNTPADQTTAMGPFDRWPTGHGFDYFYGFLAGETSQWEPRLVENTNAVEPPHDEKYHLSEDLAERGIDWLRRPPVVLARQTVLPVLGAGRRARAAPDLQGMGRQVQRQVRRRLGCLSRARLRAPEATGLDSGRYQADAARRIDGRLGQHSRSPAPVPAAADGDLSPASSSTSTRRPAS